MCRSESGIRDGCRHPARDRILDLESCRDRPQPDRLPQRRPRRSGRAASFFVDLADRGASRPPAPLKCDSWPWQVSDPSEVRRRPAARSWRTSEPPHQSGTRRPRPSSTGCGQKHACPLRSSAVPHRAARYRHRDVDPPAGFQRAQLLSRSPVQAPRAAGAQSAPARLCDKHRVRCDGRAFLRPRARSRGEIERTQPLRRYRRANTFTTLGLTRSPPHDLRSKRWRYRRRDRRAARWRRVCRRRQWSAGRPAG